MKTIRLFGMALLMLFMSVNFSACSSSSDDDNNSDNPLVGTWLGTASDSGWSNDHKIVFNSNNTGVWGQFSKSKNTWKNDDFNYTYTSDRVTFDFGDGSPEKWHYSISGNVLYLSGKNSESLSSDDKIFKLKKQ